MDALGDGIAVADVGLNVDVGGQPPEHRHRQRQSCDHAGLPCDKHRVGANVGRDRRNRRHVTGAAEVFVERARYRFVDGER